MGSCFDYKKVNDILILFSMCMSVGIGNKKASFASLAL